MFDSQVGAVEVIGGHQVGGQARQFESGQDYRDLLFHQVPVSVVQVGIIARRYDQPGNTAVGEHRKILFFLFGDPVVVAEHQVESVLPAGIFGAAHDAQVERDGDRGDQHSDAPVHLAQLVPLLAHDLQALVVRGGHEGAASRHLVKVSFGDQQGEALAQGHPADLVLFGQFVLRRHPVARFQPAAFQLLAQVVFDAEIGGYIGPFHE
ncbi:MAG: hypothetical protein BWY73_01419 [candidate division TA06 bacterium ADurb.Bin417]|uniref:Uncharacterized protein n=1 Tax=candidate division TA06 bacterium ADurb.Bin417 TaxID=1852828 RepID=A0A1V5M9R4_UNCT6|nr:MAG: hypothetical protein BWY73_01419 [candidate division TA06 bacterium ADurb.Bin417]